MSGNPPPNDHNEAAIKDEIKTHTDKIVALSKKRDQVNAEINSERKAIKALNIDLDAWRSAFKRYKMDTDVRAEFDRSKRLVDEALGIPDQADLFGGAETTPGQIPETAH